MIIIPQDDDDDDECKQQRVIFKREREREMLIICSRRQEETCPIIKSDDAVLGLVSGSCICQATVGCVKRSRKDRMSRP